MKATGSPCFVVPFTKTIIVVLKRFIIPQNKIEITHFNLTRSCSSVQLRLYPVKLKSNTCPSETKICPTSLIDEILTAVKRDEQITYQSLTLIFVAEDKKMCTSVEVNKMYVQQLF